MMDAIAERAGATVTDADAYLAISDVAKRFRQTLVLDRLDLGVARGEFVSLLGPSGCGKTTLLRIVAGLVTADSGRVSLAGRDLTRLPAHRRNVCVVFQNYALFPHLSVLDNVAFGLRSRGRPRQEIPALARKALALVRLEDYADRAITALSGGQQQRVAVARALAVEPDLLLLDEPFSALDRKLRETMQIELRQVLRELGITAIFVTHDQDEALIMSDRIAVMNEGRIEHLGQPATIYNRPATPFVLDFIGLAMRLSGKVAKAAPGSLQVDTAHGPVTVAGNFMVGAPVVVATRPEHIEIGTADGPQTNGLSLVVTELIFLGSRTLVHFRTTGGDRALAELSRLPPGGLVVGQTVSVRWPVDETLVYPDA